MEEKKRTGRASSKAGKKKAAKKTAVKKRQFVDNTSTAYDSWATAEYTFGYNPPSKEMAEEHARVIKKYGIKMFADSKGNLAE